jgi:uncharacterized LabA/DUF88 family protein
LRAALYVDGFNLYHALDDLRDHRLKWLSLHALGQTIIRRKTETLDKVVYFSAYAHFRSVRDPSVVARHRDYIAALQSTGVEIVLGNFKRKPRVCLNCHARWDSHEEKETDVNIAVQLVADAFRDVYDVAYVISADTDLVPAMKCVRSVGGQSGVLKEIIAVFPPMQNRNVSSIIQSSDRQIRLNKNHIANARLPNTINLPDGTVVNCPTRYL